jgi:pimeloyl-ACP methyl ester carboxylesterase
MGPICIKTKDGAFETGEQAVFQAALNAASDTVLLHFHGGVTSLDQGLTNATKVFASLYSNATSLTPLFFCWQSGPLDVLHRVKAVEQSSDVKNLKAVGDRWLAKNEADEAARQALFDPTLHTVVPADQAVRAAAAMFLHNDVQFQAYTQALALRVQAHAAGATDPSLESLDPSLRSALTSGVSGLAGINPTGLSWLVVVAEVLVNLFFRYFVDRRPHGDTTVIEEVLRGLNADLIGKYFWGGMKDIAMSYFKAGASGKSTADLIIDALNAKQPRRVVLVGHSAGTIIALAFLEVAATRLNAQCRLDTVLLAPAARMDFAAPKLRAMRANSELVVFVMPDANEASDQLDGELPGKIFQRSILYFVSGVAEDREASKRADAMILGMARHYDLDVHRMSQAERTTRDAVNNAVTKARLRIADTVHHHEDFEKNPETIADVLAFLNGAPPPASNLVS